ncbi:hypothetical protein Q7P37_004531 [Cladosporium fusiforme]
MARFLCLIIILVLTAVQILALPGGVEHMKAATKKPTNYNATWTCELKYKGIWESYVLTGRDWGINQTTLRTTIDKAAIVTKWKYSDWKSEGHEGFKATFNLPLLAAPRVAVYCNQWLGINPLKEDENGYLLQGIVCEYT